MNYTDEQIIKALQEMSVFKVVKLDSKNVLRPAAYLIKRLKAENEKLNSLCTSKDVIISDLNAEVERLKDSRDRWRRLALCFDKITREEMEKGNG